MHVSLTNLLFDVLTILYVILIVENHCRPTNPCKNGGLCVEMYDGYKCRCKGGYKGVDCEGKVYSAECFLVKEMMFYICKLPKSPACISEGKSKQWFARFLGSPFVLCLTGRRVDT